MIETSEEEDGRIARTDWIWWWKPEHHASWLNSTTFYVCSQQRSGTGAPGRRLEFLHPTALPSRTRFGIRIKRHSTSCLSLVFDPTLRHVHLPDPSSSHGGRIVSQDTYAAAAYRTGRGSYISQHRRGANRHLGHELAAGAHGLGRCTGATPLGSASKHTLIECTGRRLDASSHRNTCHSSKPSPSP
jgi:hypothetical protein